MPTDISNWRDPGHNIWGFQHVDKILNTDPVTKGTETKLQTCPNDFRSFRLQLSNDVALDLASFLSRTETDGLIVLKDGVVVYEHYDRTNTDESIHATFSISKSIAGLLCGILVERKKLKIDELVSVYVPEIIGSAYEDVTVRQLLDMRAGVNHDDSSPGYRKATGFYPLGPGEQPTDLHAYIPTISSSKSAPVDGLDGPPYAYVSANADLLGWVIERASGQNFADALTEHIWKPMGTESHAYVALDRGGNARVAAGVCATLRDLARIGQAILQKGQTMIPEDWVSDMILNGSEDAFSAGPERDAYSSVLDHVAYRSCWFVGKGDGILMASGTNGQLLLVDCKHGIVMAKTSSQPERTVLEKIRLSIRAFKEFTRILLQS